jgi:chemotaxis protein methyltransferase CheR
MSDKLAELCARLAGLRVDTARPYLIENRLAPLARREGFASTAGLLGALELAPDLRLAWAAVEAMAAPAGGFFAEPAVFDWLTSEALPALARERAGSALRVWVADCGAGQEIYSLAMAISEARGLAERVELYASDLSERSLEAAQIGVYSAYEVQRGLSARRLVRHFEARGEAFAVSARLRARIGWRRVNLHDTTTPLGRFDLVMCRNTLARMTTEAGTAAAKRLVGALNPGGLLVLAPETGVPDGVTPARRDLGGFRADGAADRHAA